MCATTPKTRISNNEIYEILLEEILNLTLPPGTFIGEVEMSNRFNISRTPIREVFKRLEIEGLIKVISNKGTVITPINFNAISEFMYVREKLEIGLIEDLINIITEDNLAKLSINVLKQKKLITNKDFTPTETAYLFYELDNEFHSLIFSFMNKESIWQMIMSILPDYKRFRCVFSEFNTKDNFLELYKHHSDILSALEKKDLQLLKTLYKEHIYFANKNFRQLIQTKEDYFII